MKNYRLQTFAAGLTIAVLILFGAWGQPGPRAVHAQTEPGTILPTRTITVLGEGQVSIKPDTAHATVGVDVVKPTIKEAYTENQQRFDTLFAALKAQGIAEKDIQTSGFNVYMEQVGDPNGADTKTQYHVSNNVDITIRQLDTVGSVLDAAITAGANSINGVTFSLDETSSADAQARTAAVANAQAKAAELAKLNGVTVGDVLSISEVSSNGPVAPVAFAASRVDSGTTIAPGELTISQQVQVTYLITK